MITVEEARARGITLPSDEDAAQALVDEQEAWLARRIGPLDEEFVETFYVGVRQARGRLALRRFTDAVVVEDNGAAVDPDRIALLDRGASVGLVYPYAPWWTGPYVTVTYTPNDELEVRRVLYQLLALEQTPDTAGLQSETLGDYSYSRGAATADPVSQRAALVASLLPKRDPALTIIASSSRYLAESDPVINRAEPWP